jgi:4-hydroxy-tetrahydrodipicolinate synthase
MNGVIAAVPTPVDSNGKPIKDLFLSHCAWALENGCDGLNILGSTGEANSFDKQTRMEVMTWAAVALDKSKLMVGTGTPSLAETIDLTKKADELGYGVALVLPPYYYSPVSEGGLENWYWLLHSQLGDRAIQIYFYNFPQMTGLVIPVSVIQRLNDSCHERFSGIKDSSGDLEYCRELVRKLPSFKVFPSSEVSLGEAAKSGFAGCVSATINQTAALCAKLWENKQNPDGKLVEQIGAIREKITGPDLIPSIKYLVAKRTNDPSWEPLLPPLLALTEERKPDLDYLFELLSNV